MIQFLQQHQQQKMLQHLTIWTQENFKSIRWKSNIVCCRSEQEWDKITIVVLSMAKDFIYIFVYLLISVCHFVFWKCFFINKKSNTIHFKWTEFTVICNNVCHWSLIFISYSIRLTLLIHANVSFFMSIFLSWNFILIIWFQTLIEQNRLKANGINYKNKLFLSEIKINKNNSFKWIQKLSE